MWTALYGKILKNVQIMNISKLQKPFFYSFKFLYVLFYVSIIINQINKKYLNDSIKAYILFFLRRFCQVQYFTLLGFQNVNSIIR